MTAETMTETRVDPVLMAVLANRFDAICREMTNTLFRSGRSAVLNTARDFSCSIATADDELLTAAEGLPLHVIGCHLQTSSMRELHPELAEGDAFLHNDPYAGNTHAADHTILVPVFVDGEHVFTACAKAHQADCGNAAPTTYSTFARDVYEEGALIFPCVRVERDYEEISDIVRMCRRRIRVPDQWYGDYLAALGAARIGERRLKELAEKYGVETLRAFATAWFDYSERRMEAAIRELPSGTVRHEKYHDPLPPVAPDGIPVRVTITTDADAGIIEVDLTENEDVVDGGLNLSEATAIGGVMTGIFYCLDPTIPHNAGSFRRLRVRLREGSVIGKPEFPTCCSVATTNVMNTLVNVAQSAFSLVGDGWGLAQGGNSLGAGYGVISGHDSRRDGAPFINQLIMGENGGPASPVCDGWVTYGVPGTGGVMYRDSVEITEQKYPVQIRSFGFVADTAGAGRFRGGAAARIVFGPREDPVTVMYACDGVLSPAEGACGGLPGNSPYVAKIDAAGGEAPLPTIGGTELQPGEWISGMECGGGGYGPPTERDPDAVRRDVLEGWVSTESAESIYAVRLSTGPDGDIVVDTKATKALRESAGQVTSR